MRWKTTAFLAVIFAALATFFYVYEIRQRPTREKAAAEKDRLWKNLSAGDVETVVLARGAERVRLEKSGDDWRLTAPVEDRADQQAADSLVASLVTLRMEREIDAHPSSVVEYGLGRPPVEITITAKGQEHGLRLGDANPTGSSVYAQKSGQPAVLLVAESLSREARKSASDFRDRTALAFKRQDVTGLEIQTRDGSVLAAERRDPEAWEVTTPASLPGDREAIAALLDQLERARIKEFVVERTDSPEAYGLDQPLRVTIQLAKRGDGTTAKTLRLGAPVPAKEAVYGQREGEATVFLVDGALVGAVPTSVTALRDKRVLAYDRAALERVELESPKGRVVLLKEDAGWRIAEPANLPADEAAVNELLWKVEDLRAQDFVTDHGAALGSFGLDPPHVRLALWEKGAPEPKTLRLGRGGDQGEVYAIAGGSATPGSVVLVDVETPEELGRSMLDLRDRRILGPFDTEAVARLRIERGDAVLELSREGPGEWKLTRPRSGKARGAPVGDAIWALRGLRWRELVAEEGWEATQYGLDPPQATVTLSDERGKVLAALALGKPHEDLTYVRVAGRPELYLVESQGLADLPTGPDDLL